MASLDYWPAVAVGTTESPSNTLGGMIWLRGPLSIDPPEVEYADNNTAPSSAFRSRQTEKTEREARNQCFVSYRPTRSVRSAAARQVSVP